jgi:hypothetical protein
MAGREGGLHVPLLDHFHPPLSQQRHWESFHGQWAGSLAHILNSGLLPPGYFAEMQVTLAGGRVEVDVPTMEQRGNGASGARPDARQGGVATLTAPVWAPPAPELELPAVFPDDLEVLVFGTEGGPILVGAIELVSPRNKDRPEARRAFAVKCLAYLQQGVGLVIVDIVTSRRANLHDEMIALLPAGAPVFPGTASLYVAGYRPFRRQKDERIAVWPVALAVGQELPAMPLWLRGVAAPVRVDLEAAYTEARQRSLLA